MKSKTLIPETEQKKKTTKKASTTTKKATTSKTTKKKTTAKKTTTTKKQTTTKQPRVRLTPEEKEQRRILALEEKQIAANAALPKPAKEIPYDAKTAYNDNKEFVVTLSPLGDLLINPVPTCCDVDTFARILACCPEVPNDDIFSLKASISRTAFGKAQIITTAYEGTGRRINTFAQMFDIKNDTAAIGGNLVFIGNGKGLTKAEANKVFNQIVEVIQKEEVLDIAD